MRFRQHRGELVPRIGRLHGAIQLGILAVAVGYWYVQVAEGGSYRELADNNRLRKLSIESPRGLIHDRHGRPLVENVPSYDLLIDRSRVRNRETSLGFASEILEIPIPELEEELAEHEKVPTFRPVLLARELSLQQVARFSAQHLEYPEYEIAVQHLRLYRHGRHTAHVLGFLGEVTEADLEAPLGAYRPGDTLGKSGIEARYEHQLRGQRGEQVVIVDSRGQTIDEFRRDSATPGKNLGMTIDLALQQEAMRQLEGRVGAIVALDPRHGEVLAMASAPSFDPNRFARRLRPEEWREVLDHPHHPLQNRALQNTYPPGSVFKIVMALAGLELGAIDRGTTAYCRGYSMLYGNRYRCWQASGHGRVDLRSSLKRSCNVYYHQLGQELEIDSIAEYARMFGFGRTTGIDLGGEKTGLVPDSQWSLARRGAPWYPGETISVSTGQGPILVTPLQVAVMTAAVANGGHLVIPRLVQRIGDKKVQPGRTTLAASLPARALSKEHLEWVREALWSVVNEKRGTAAIARIEGFEIAGKTGTAQVVKQETWTSNDELPEKLRDHAWFTSYAPAEDPRLVVTVFVEHGGAGSEGAAPLAKAIYRQFFGGRSSGS